MKRALEEQYGGEEEVVALLIHVKHFFLLVNSLQELVLLPIWLLVAFWSWFHK